MPQIPSDGATSLLLAPGQSKAGAALVRRRACPSWIGAAGDATGCHTHIHMQS